MLSVQALQRLIKGYETAAGQVRDRWGAAAISEATVHDVCTLMTRLALAPESSHAEPHLTQIVQAAGQGLEPYPRNALLTALRPALTFAFSFAVPTAQILDHLAARGPVVEVGAGSGYWASLLALRGARVIAFDRVAPAPNFGPGRQCAHFEVRIGGPREALSSARDARTLLLCWPPGLLTDPRTEKPTGYSTMAEHSLAGFTGDTVALIGERDDGNGPAPNAKSFGSPAFYSDLDQRFALDRLFPLPNLAKWRDAARVYRRR